MSSMRTFKTHLYNILTVIENKLTDWSVDLADQDRRHIKISRFIHFWVPKNISDKAKLSFAVAEVDAEFEISLSEWKRFAHYFDHECDGIFQFQSKSDYILYFRTVGSDSCEFSYKKLFGKSKFRTELTSVQRAINVCREYGYI